MSREGLRGDTGTAPAPSGEGVLLSVPTLLLAICILFPLYPDSFLGQAFKLPYVPHYLI